MKCGFKFLLFFWMLSIHAVWGGSPSLLSISPYYGPSLGQTEVHITGAGFTGTTAVYFGSSPASYTVHSDSAITATAPLHVPGAVFITVVTGAGTSSTHELAYYVYQGPTSAYLCAYNAGIYVVNTSAPTTIVKTVDIIPSGGLSITPDGTKVFVAEPSTQGFVSVIDSASGLIDTQITVGGSPYSILMNPNGNAAFIANSSSNTVSIIENSHDYPVSTLTFQSEPNTLTTSSEGLYLYVGDDADNVYTINISTDQISKAIASSEITNLVIDPSNQYLYITDQNDGLVVVFDISTNSPIKFIQVGTSPQAIAITPDGTQVYVANANDGTISVIDSSSFEVISTIQVGFSPVAIAIKPDGTQIYVANFQSSTISIIDRGDFSVKNVTVQQYPIAIAITPDGLQAYVACYNNYLSVINTVNYTVSSVAVGSSPVAVAIAPDQAPLSRFQAILQSQNLQETTFLFDGSSSVSPTGNIVSYTWDFGDSSPIVVLNEPTVTHSFQTPNSVHPASYAVMLTVTNSSGTSVSKQLTFSSSSPEYATFVNNGGMLNNGGPSAQSVQYITVPALPPLYPNFGSSLGGTSVMLTGVNLASVTAVHFGSTPAQFTVQSNSSIVATAPLGEGDVDVTVVTPSRNLGDASIVSKLDVFHYAPTPPRCLKGYQFKAKSQGGNGGLINVLQWKKARLGHPIAYHVYADKGLKKLLGTVPADHALKFTVHHVKRKKCTTYYVTSVGANGYQSEPSVVQIGRKK